MAKALVLACPSCGSERLYKDGLRYQKTGRPIQRYLCRECGYRFSGQSCNGQGLNRKSGKGFRGRIGAKPNAHGLVENLTITEPLKDGLAGATTDVKGKTVRFVWQLKKEGLKDTTIRTYAVYLKMLVDAGADLNNPETVKEVLAAKKEWSKNTKALAIATYTKFLGFAGGYWKPPKCRRIRKLPFIPLEKEIDAVICAARKKLATFLTLLKETGLRSGEAWNLKWIDLDFERRTLTVNEPEKYGKPRVLKISSTLIAMLKSMKADKPTVFKGTLLFFRQSYLDHRRRLAVKLKNPRLLRITFHTLRHWKATMEYHKTKDILYVKELLGHRDINTTLLYTQLVDFKSEEYHTATAKTVERARELAEAGYELFDTIEEVHIYRKRK